MPADFVIVLGVRHGSRELDQLDVAVYGLKR